MFSLALSDSPQSLLAGLAVAKFLGGTWEKAEVFAHGQQHLLPGNTWALGRQLFWPDFLSRGRISQGDSQNLVLFFFASWDGCIDSGHPGRLTSLPEGLPPLDTVPEGPQHRWNQGPRHRP